MKSYSKNLSLAILSVAVVCLALCTPSFAQSTPFGSSGFGSSSSGTAGGGQATTSTSPFSGGLSSGLLSTATSSAFGAQILSNTLNSGANQLGRSQGFGLSGLGNRGQGRGQFNSRNNRGNQGGRNNRVNVRTVLRIGFTPIRPSATKITTSLQKQFDGINLSSLDAGIKVSTAPAEKKRGIIAVLTGTVSSAHRRTLAGRLAMLEPGVVGVQNQLIVSPAVTSESESP